MRHGFSLHFRRWNLLACVVLFWIKSNNLAFARQQPCHLFYLFIKFNFSVNATMCQMRETNWTLNTKSFTRRFAFGDECRCPTSFQYKIFLSNSLAPPTHRRRVDATSPHRHSEGCLSALSDCKNWRIRFDCFWWNMKCFNLKRFQPIWKFLYSELEWASKSLRFERVVAIRSRMCIHLIGMFAAAELC